MPFLCAALVLWGGIESPLRPTEALSQNQPGRAVADIARCARSGPLALVDLSEAVVYDDTASPALASEAVAVATHGTQKNGRTPLENSESPNFHH